MVKRIKVKTRKAKRIKRKYEITSIDKISITKEEKNEAKNPTKGLAYTKI